MPRVLVVKSFRRKAFEVLAYIWGLGGLVMGFATSRGALISVLSGANDLAALLLAIVYSLLWIGGLIFFGLLALLAPVETRDG